MHGIDLPKHLGALKSLPSARQLTSGARIIPVATLLSRPISRSETLYGYLFWHHSFRLFLGTEHVGSAAHALGVLHGFWVHRR